MSLSFSTADIDYVRVINASRFELESAGNPSYVVVVVAATGDVLLSPMVFATVGPAAEHAQRLIVDCDDDELVLIISRSAAGKRAMFTIIEPKNHKKLHQRLEVIEDSWKETDGPI